VGFLDTLLGRTKPVQPNLDALFELPTAAVTLQAAMGLAPTGSGSVCFRAAEGRGSEYGMDFPTQATAGNEHQPLGAFGVLVAELQRHATPKRMADDGAASLVQRFEEIAK